MDRINASGPDFYAILGLTKGATKLDVESQFSKRTLECHRDREMNEPLKRRRYELSDIQNAYETLVDDGKRAIYDFQSSLRTGYLNDKNEQSAYARRQEFLSFALQLYDEMADLPANTSTNETPAPTSVALQPQLAEAEKRSDSIEDEIKERNDVREKLRGVGQNNSPDLKLKTEAKRARKEILHAVPVEQLNLEVMNPKCTDVYVDIVAVHGLGAIPDITWKERISGINWLSHETMLPSATPQARILRFGYDSLWMGKTPIRTSLSTIAYKLLLSLSMNRVENLQRPLIFIGHCFGGLVIQRALNLAKMQHNAYPGVFDSSVGIVFLGTPHRGTKSFTRNSALFAAIAASSDLSQKFETTVLNSLASEDGGLLDVTDDFVNLCAGPGPNITCFYEQRPSKLGKIVGRDDIDEFIVDQNSATLDGHHKYGLELDHFSLNKFDRPNNPNYLQVRAEIRRFYDAAVKRVAHLSTETRSGNPNALSSKLNLRHKASQLLEISMTPIRRFGSPDLRHSSHLDSNTRSMPLTMGAQREMVLARDKEEDIKKNAMKELRDEQAEKQRISFDINTQAQRLEEKRSAERHYLERLKKNVAKYGIQNPTEILASFPLPDDTVLSMQQIKDKEKWHKNLIRGELNAAGLDGGQIDEVLNDTGETMVIDSIETTFTRVDKKWISTRTLDKYNIPWQVDEEESSAIIIKRWVPDYERDFLWDHSQAVRDSRGRRPYREHHRRPQTSTDAQTTNGIRPIEQIELFTRMMGAFNDVRRGRDKGNSNDSNRLMIGKLIDVTQVTFSNETLAGDDGQHTPQNLFSHLILHVGQHHFYPLTDAQQAANPYTPPQTKMKWIDEEGILAHLVIH
ncbi:hypothetical protein HBI56_048280 [Parastagonospora nodorum]|nr:hypothetical protein HBH52_114240 [Parastagonospora nodorum]KAH4178658.1 hypothetical protein HBH43_026970 [Parastagonospora nodorum]KAH4206972.1 hypothetical protein HBI95_110620 [Parastagonospora nodorum]KAH4348771.1 hypothetical protein HBH98_072160 [Parastagonospora nodorum]KAH4391694.1 hypothetical protein HBH97_039810 [Parastagonospora nodorum]